eukprot:scaffold126165_cov33-Tisochrysis_lutea.AAC.4
MPISRYHVLTKTKDLSLCQRPYQGLVSRGARGQVLPPLPPPAPRHRQPDQQTVTIIVNHHEL